MYKYEIIMFWSEDDNAYVTVVPELPGCMADGDTPGDAIANTQRVISEWIDTARELGREVPEPKNKPLFA